MSNDDDSYTARVRAVLGGQIAPEAQGGGRRILLRCPRCGAPWLMDGPHSFPRLSDEQLAATARELSADMGRLPYATCPICQTQGLGEIMIDAYGGAGDAGGYGVSVELIEPTGGHLLGTVLRLDWAERQARLGGRSNSHAGIVTDFTRCRAFLAWLAAVPSPTSYRPITAEDSRGMALSNPPGHRAPGTEGWRWCGATWTAPCPALGGRVLANLAQAMPGGEEFSMGGMLATWRLLARMIEQGHITGETSKPGSEEERTP